MYAVFADLLQKKGVRVSDVSKATGINPSVFSDWKTGRDDLKADKLQKIADYFGVSVEYLMTGKEDDTVYYYNKDVRDIAEFLFHNPEYTALLKATQKIKKEDIAFIKEFIERSSR